VQLREMENRKRMVFEEVRERVKQNLMDKEHEKVMEKWEDNLLRSAGFIVYDQTIKEVLAELVAKEPPKLKGS
jgi:hypothetical protein